MTNRAGAGPKRIRVARIGLVLLAVIVSVLASVIMPAGIVFADELGGGKWITIVDGSGSPISTTGFGVKSGDEYVDEDNNLWRITQVTGDTAVATYVRTLDMSRAVSDFQVAESITAAARTAGSQVGIYHTHSDESYVPTDGTDSDPTGHGGVYAVGAALTNSLKQAGMSVVHSLASHLPHDGGAYQRSRATATQVLKGSAAIFDVHRDAGPREAYERNVGGTNVAQVMIVVGRENPKVESNMSFARALKAAADKAFPGLVKGILSTGGTFNQDLSSRALLLEVGAHTNPREEAEAAVTKLASVVPSVVSGGTGAGGQSSGAWRAAGIIALAVVVGGGLWLFVATGGSFREAWNKIRSLGEEFASYFGRRRRRS